MLEVVFPFMGGIGLFLVGMMLLSNGLVAFGGASLKRALVRFTGTPFTAFVSGTLVTAVAQSSTATTVTLIGFVSAGLITFSQAIGVVIGASLGNTATGWIVAGLGLKVNLGFYTLPLIGLGAMLKLMTRGRWAELGLAVAGFGLMFLGLNTLQEGMRGLSGVFSLASLPTGGYGARIAIMLIGLVMTAVLQSSTAAVATTLTALHAEAINFEQAAALVVGASIGTTLTGALVTIGATIYAKRTAMAHILFNLGAGLIAIALLPAFFYVLGILSEQVGLTPGATSLAAFHSLFIGVGVLVFLPFTQQFANVVERILPERGQDMTQRMDASLLSIPAVALEASQRTLEHVADHLFQGYTQMLSMSHSDTAKADLEQTSHALDQTFDFVSRILLPVGDEALVAQRIAQLHCLDHLMRFRSRLNDFNQARIDFSNPVYQWALGENLEMLKAARKALAEHTLADQLERMDRGAVTLARMSHQVRHELLQDTGPGSSTSRALRTTDSFRWLERTGNHIARICHYLSQGRLLSHGADGQLGVPVPHAVLSEGDD